MKSFWEKNKRDALFTLRFPGYDTNIKKTMIPIETV